MDVCFVRTEKELDIAARLFTAYEAQLEIDLTYQGFSHELVALPGCYARPKGEILLAQDAGIMLGCVALRPMEKPGHCEMKRLYLMPEARGKGAGKLLVESIMRIAKDIGYTQMFLDTLPSMHAAIRLYEQAGFKRTCAYYDTPIEQTVFFALDLK